jgi:hypothetical protein
MAKQTDMRYLTGIVFLLHFINGTCAATAKDTLNYKEIYSLALKRDVAQILHLLDTIQLDRPEDIDFKKQFELRFKYAADSTDYAAGIPENIKPLYKIFQQYWRESLLDKEKNLDQPLKDDLLRLFRLENEKNKFTDSAITAENIEHLYSAYIRSKGLNTTDYGKTGFLYDLIAWKSMTSKTYSISLINDTVDVKVNFIDDFISLGWLAYARMGKTSPGGWATKKELYCVMKGYDTTSEKFKASYLKHEGQHFADYQQFGELPPADLEYRAKLTELYYGKETLSALIQSFINGAKYDSTNSHPFANYCVIRDMSRSLFNKEFERNTDRWKKLPAATINRAAKKLFIGNTADLQKGLRLR